MFEQTFKNIDDVLWKEAGCTTELDYTEQTSWLKNRFQSGYSLRDALEYIDELRFRSQQEKHERSHLYEAKIKNMGNAGRNGGEYYTQRPYKAEESALRKPQEILDEIAALDAESAEILAGIGGML